MKWLLYPQLAEVALIEITDQVISVQAFVDRVTNESNGGIVIFIGIVRDFPDKRRLVYMEYDAYIEMAKKKMSEIRGKQALFIDFYWTTMPLN